MAAVMLTGGRAPADERDDALALVTNARTVLQEMTSRAPGQRIPPEVLANSHGIVILPAGAQAGPGGPHGGGVVLGHQPGGRFSSPSLVTTTGGSRGAPGGAERSSVLLVLNNAAALDRFMVGGLRLGTEVSVVAGPTGTTGIERADVYAYADREADFAVSALAGATVTNDADRAAVLYRRPTTASSLLAGQAQGLRVPWAAADLRRALAQYAHRTR
ncbi:MAG TPA: lipid-binding SYLF domain-containing protein [Polyangia bacterium]